MAHQKAYRVYYSRKDTEGWERSRIIFASSSNTARKEAKKVLGKSVIIKGIKLEKPKKDKKPWADVWYDRYFR